MQRRAQRVRILPRVQATVTAHRAHPDVRQLRHRSLHLHAQRVRTAALAQAVVTAVRVLRAQHPAVVDSVVVLLAAVEDLVAVVRAPVADRVEEDVPQVVRVANITYDIV